MTSIDVYDYLTWEYSTDPDIQYLACPPPGPMREHMPPWFKQLKARRPTVDIAEQQTIRNCLGFRGIAHCGYAIPLPEEVTCYDTHFNRGRLHPDMIAGTPWAHKEPGRQWAADDYSEYEYSIRLLHWPWRARMTRGWRLLILPYLLDWSQDWTEFAGTVEPNYEVNHGTDIGSGLKWSHTIDSKYNYYNIETVVALRRGTTIPKGTLTMCLLPYFDPELFAQQG